jgi:ribosome-binding protein aMBF1 (putative translation factor)
MLTNEQQSVFLQNLQEFFWDFRRSVLLGNLSDIKSCSARFHDELTRVYRGIIGDWLRQRRADCGITQSELSEALGVSQSYLSRVEVGSAYVRDSKIIHFIEQINTLSEDKNSS